MKLISDDFLPWKWGQSGKTANHKEKKQLKKDDNDKLHVDHMTEAIGEYKKWQMIWSVLPALSIATHAWMMLGNKWVTYEVDHWCVRPDGLSDIDVQSWRNISAPMKINGEYDQCNIFDIDYSVVGERPNEDTKTIACTKWEYDRSLFQDTATERWDLVCERRSLRRVIQMVFFLGNFIGVFSSGFVSDKLGRKFCFLLYLFLWIVSGVVGSFIPYLPLWIFTRFLCGAFSLGYKNALSVFSIELTHGKWRAVCSAFIDEGLWNVGAMTLALMVYYVRNMVTFELVVGLSNVPFLILIFLMPESARWLLATGKKEKALKVLEKAADLNKRDVEGVRKFVKNYNEEGENLQGSYMDLFRDPAVRRNSICMCLSWYSFSMGYFGLMYNTPALEWSTFVVFAFPAILGFFLCFVDPLMENYFGRKFMLTIPLTSAGVLLVISTLMPKGSSIIIVLAWTGTILCGLAFGDGYTFTKELYPTTLRTQALSTASAAARLGSISSPFIGMLDEFHKLLPIVVYGIIIFVAGFMSLFIWPETTTIHLPDSLEECKEQARTPNKWISWAKCTTWTRAWTWTRTWTRIRTWTRTRTWT